MGIKLVALDMDGTTLDSNICLAPETREAIVRAIDAGVHVVPCTGRVFAQLPREILGIPGLNYAVTANGARVTDLRENNTLIYENPIHKDVLSMLLEIVTAYPVLLEVYIGGRTYMERSCFDAMGSYGVPEEYYSLFAESCQLIDSADDFKSLLKSQSVEKVNIFCSDTEIKGRMAKALNTTGEVMVTTSMETNLEINAATANKGDGLFHLCKNLGLHAQDVMAIGDSNNDMEMLKYAGLAVAMENASKPIKAISNFITTTNDALGVANAMNRFISSEWVS
ncbi:MULTISPECIES: Cof-type HAD-IIB family hydrolase [Eubacterium]|uniref:Cof subfamily of IIB subfamily of haloacid dehalogenase superfamily/HAD-superfamily hydrolase, subfamily IIB n=1 Tax=Eubacterium barkeri TaxID=1528 RepID=A0A1H3G3V3_EUBBA|nr:Cof-type HAD-IIB family hydrolase [Eubacterium barkeri]SDX97114.1 hypothetical protein SAMN04488579_11255 [Eubacterium barkeri]